MKTINNDKSNNIYLIKILVTLIISMTEIIKKVCLEINWKFAKFALRIHLICFCLSFSKKTLIQKTENNFFPVSFLLKLSAQTTSHPTFNSHMSCIIANIAKIAILWAIGMLITTAACRRHCYSITFNNFPVFFTFCQTFYDFDDRRLAVLLEENYYMDYIVGIGELFSKNAI